MKHVERRHLYVRELVENGRLRVPFVRTADNLADLFTKPLAGNVFFPLRDRVMNVPLSQRETRYVRNRDSPSSPATGGR